jgi:DNA processing protein
MSACAPCLARALLLRKLAAHIDRAVDRTAKRRARELLALGDEELCLAVAPAREPAELLVAAAAADAHADERDALAAVGGWSVCRHSPGWPSALARLGDAEPRALFGRGSAELLASAGEFPAVAVIGARRADAYGREVARTLGREIAAVGVPVVSGLAFGIDAEAHEGALAAPGPALAVLGTGVDRPYPRASRRLWERIAAAGTVISELPTGSPTFRWMFPARNRLMAALAELTVVVQAAERSGSLITAEMASELGRTVGAVPGPVTAWRSAGANALLAEGALVIRDCGDVLDAVLGPGARPRPAVAGPPLPEPARSVLEAVERGAGSLDRIAAACGLSAGELVARLAELELAGYVSSDPGGRWSRTAQPSPAGGAAPTTIGA